MTHVTPVCTNVSDCIIMNSLLNASADDLMLSILIAVGSGFLIVAYFYVSRLITSHKRKKQ